jgi:hypothetical protein
VLRVRSESPAAERSEAETAYAEVA